MNPVQAAPDRAGGAWVPAQRGSRAPSRPGSWPGLLGRRTVCDRLSAAVAAAKAGRSQVLVLRGEPGIGKTALLQFLLDRAEGCWVARASGVESEMELAFASLHQLCGPFLDRLNKLPGPQRDALGTAFGLQRGTVRDHFEVGLAVLHLLSSAADERPLVCLVDDAQWLDRASSATLELVARRLAAEPVAMVFGSRASADALTGLPELTLGGLGPRDASALLDSAAPSTLDPRVRERLLAESGGNPLAILELPRGLASAELAFGGDGGGRSAGPRRPPLAQRLQQDMASRVDGLPQDVRLLLLTAAADTTGDVLLLRRAAARLGVPPGAASVAETSWLVTSGDRVRFRHPLVRSAVYGSATGTERRRVHAALAEATDAEVDPDRRAWHRATAAAAPDERIAQELERSADRAMAQGGVAAAAAFLDQAARFTPDATRRAQRCLDAASAKMTAGELDDASALLAAAQQLGSLAEHEHARTELVQAQLALASQAGAEPLGRLLEAARRLQSTDADLARDTCLEAMSAAVLAGRLAAGAAGTRQVAVVSRSTPGPAVRRARHALLEALALRCTDGYGPAASVSRAALDAFATAEASVDEVLRFSSLAATTAASLWDDAAWDAITRRHVDLARRVGAVTALPRALTSRVLLHLFTGDMAAAASLVDESRVMEDVAGRAAPPCGAACLAAVEGVEARAEPLLRDCQVEVTACGEGLGLDLVLWARALLCNSLGRYDEALAAAREAAADPQRLGPSAWALVELVEAAVRTGDDAAATAGQAALTDMARASGTEWALGVAASRRALLSGGDDADQLHREAIEHLGRTRMRLEQARAQLLYGEWLRRAGRRVDARAQLRTAYETLLATGAVAFAERARRELLATGETVRKRTVDTAGALTPQEAHIARVAAQGCTNSEIGAALYISPRTVEWHLRKVFAKLGVSNRQELRRSLRDQGRAGARD